MVEISVNRNANELEISSYDGKSGEIFTYPVTFEKFGMKEKFSEFVKEEKTNLALFPPKTIMIFEKND